MKEIEEQVENDPTYTSSTEFIRTAVREKLERIKQEVHNELQ